MHVALPCINDRCSKTFNMFIWWFIQFMIWFKDGNKDRRNQILSMKINELKIYK